MQVYDQSKERLSPSAWMMQQQKKRTALHKQIAAWGLGSAILITIGLFARMGMH